MTYIILAAGKGSTLSPLTFNYPKTSYKIDSKTTVLQRLVRGIRKYDNNAEIVVVVGYLYNKTKEDLIDENVKFIFNPFYEVTNSIASLWFASEFLERENVTILNGDMVYEDSIISNCIVKDTDKPYIALDTSKVVSGEYNAVIESGKILVMSKNLENATAKYCSITKLDAVSCRLLKEEINEMLRNNMYNQYFENALVQMIMYHDFELNYIDLVNTQWTEVNTVDDLLKAQKIHNYNGGQL